MLGFSLTEMMITLTIAVIILSLATPGLSQLISKNQIATQASEMVANLTLARSEAIKRSVRSTICPSDSGTACTNTDWTAGYIVFVDLDGDGSLDTGTDTILRVSSRLSGKSTLTSNGFSTALPLQFLPSGQSGKAGGFSLCQTGQVGRIIAITLAGGVSAIASSSDCP